jgi:predicted metalloprotease
MDLRRGVSQIGTRASTIEGIVEMRWEDFRQSDNVEDYRGSSGGGGMNLPGGAGGLGIGTVLVLGVLGWALGVDPRLLINGAEILSGSGTGQYQQQAPRRSGPAPTDAQGKFVRAILGDTEDRWKDIFERANKRYTAPKLAIFSGQMPSACGRALAAMGPFYCPTDQKIYLDTSFFRDIEQRFRGCDVGSRGCQFAQAYVIAHEVGHHVQNLLGILPKVQQMQRGMDKAEANALQVRVELQADCFAGIWANQSQQKWRTIDQSDIDAALRTASAIGDDRLQRQSRGTVVPESFTHGSSEQRKRWFSIGFKTGSIAACNTFKAQTTSGL